MNSSNTIDSIPTNKVTTNCSKVHYLSIECPDIVTDGHRRRSKLAGITRRLMPVYKGIAGWYVWVSKRGKYSSVFTIITYYYFFEVTVTPVSH